MAEETFLANYKTGLIHGVPYKNWHKYRTDYRHARNKKESAIVDCSIWDTVLPKRITNHFGEKYGDQFSDSCLAGMAWGRQ